MNRAVFTLDYLSVPAGTVPLAGHHVQSDPQIGIRDTLATYGIRIFGNSRHGKRFPFRQRSRANVGNTTVARWTMFANRVFTSEQEVANGGPGILKILRE